MDTRKSVEKFVEECKRGVHSLPPVYKGGIISPQVGDIVRHRNWPTHTVAKIRNCVSQELFPTAQIEVGLIHHSVVHRGNWEAFIVWLPVSCITLVDRKVARVRIREAPVPTLTHSPEPTRVRIRTVQPVAN